MKISSGNDFRGDFVKNNAGCREIALLKSRNLLGSMFILAVLANACPARAARANESVRERNLENLGGLVAQARESLSGDACQEVLQEFHDSTAGIGDNPKLIDAYLFMIAKSTDSQCVLGVMGYLEPSIIHLDPYGRLTNRPNPRIEVRTNQWMKIGRILSGILVNVKWDDIRILNGAADILARMGPRYRQAAYSWYVQELEKLSNQKYITDDDREECSQIMLDLWSDRRKVPAKFFQQIAKKIDLAGFLKSRCGQGPYYKNKIELRKLNHLIEMN